MMIVCWAQAVVEARLQYPADKWRNVYKVWPQLSMRALRRRGWSLSRCVLLCIASFVPLPLLPFLLALVACLDQRQLGLAVSLIVKVQLALHIFQFLS